MKTVWALVLGFLILSPICRAADPAPKDNSAGDAAWAEILKNSKPPAPPAEWNTKRPTAEEMTAFKHKAGEAAEQLADRVKKFYETYPDHPKAAEAHAKEKTFRQQAAALRAVKEDKPTNTAGAPENADDKMDPAFKAKYLEAQSRIRAARKDGPPAVLAEFEKSGRDLIKEFPKQIEPWEWLIMVAQESDGAKAIELLTEVSEKAPDPRMKEFAAEQLKSLNRLNKPITLAYKAVDDRDVDIAKLKGKVVLIDFWATWCAPCIVEMPYVKKLYDELHDEGLEIVGVSLDNDCETMKKFVMKSEIPWPQYCDGGGVTNAINREFSVHIIPTMYLVDKKGVLRDMKANEDLAAKVRALLKE